MLYRVLRGKKAAPATPAGDPENQTMSIEIERLRALAADAAAGEREAQHNIIRAEMERLLKPLGPASAIVILTVDERRMPDDPTDLGVCDAFTGGVMSLDGMRGIASLFGRLMEHWLSEAMAGGAKPSDSLLTLVMLSETLKRLQGPGAPEFRVTRLPDRPGPESGL